MLLSGAREVPCAREERDAAFLRLRRAAPSQCGRGWSHGEALVKRLEALYTGDEWSSPAAKAQWLAKRRLLSPPLVPKDSRDYLLRNDPQCASKLQRGCIGGGEQGPPLAG